MATLAEDYLRGRHGDLTLYLHQLEMGLRPGQAFFNSLCEYDKERLRGTIHDCFYYELPHKLEEAIQHLLETEERKKDNEALVQHQVGSQEGAARAAS